MVVLTVSGVLTLALMLLLAGWAWRRRVEPRR
jgi:MYXO-CTERM domain-containing protein